MSTPKTTVTIMVAVASVAVVLTALVAGLMTANRTLPTSGTITTIGLEAYTTRACTTRMTSVDWGALAPGGSVTRTVYLKNNGTTSENLSCTYDGWTPASASNYITVTWNCSGYSLASGGVTGATFILTVSSSITGISSYSLNLRIAGTA